MFERLKSEEELCQCRVLPLVILCDASKAARLGLSHTLSVMHATPMSISPANPPQNIEPALNTLLEQSH